MKIYKIQKGVTQMTYKFSTMTTEQFNKQDMDKFINYFDQIWISKEPFTVQLNSKDIELYLFIEHTDFLEFEDTLLQEVSIGIVPSYNSLSDKYKDKILSEFTKEEQDSVKNNPKELLYDIMLYGLNITLHTETTQNTNEVDHLIKSAIAVSPCVSGLIGFDLDKTLNRIGNTGWDFLSDYCEGADLIKLAIDKSREVNKGE